MLLKNPGNSFARSSDVNPSAIMPPNPPAKIAL
jgi:hypothetical protein